MTDYSKLSDDEINECIGEIALKGRWSCRPGASGNESNIWIYGSMEFSYPLPQLPDYCNSWADAGPIIEENKIHLIYENDAWDCRGYTNRHIPVDVSDKKPLRAALIVFLMMKDAENEPRG